MRKHLATNNKTGKDMGTIAGMGQMAFSNSLPFPVFSFSCAVQRVRTTWEGGGKGQVWGNNGKVWDYGRSRGNVKVGFRWGQEVMLMQHSPSHPRQRTHSTVSRYDRSGKEKMGMRGPRTKGSEIRNTLIQLLSSHSVRTKPQVGTHRVDPLRLTRTHPE